MSLLSYSNPFTAQVGTPPNYLSYIYAGSSKETVKKMIEEDIKKTRAKWVSLPQHQINATYQNMTSAGMVRVTDLETQLFAVENMPDKPEPKEVKPQTIIIQTPEKTPEVKTDYTRAIIIGGIVITIFLALIVWRLK